MFRAMFAEGTFAEATSGYVQVTDMKPENLENLISYIYTDRVKLFELVH